MSCSKINLKEEIASCNIQFENIDVSYSHSNRENYLRFTSNTRICGMKKENPVKMFKQLMVAGHLNNFYSKIAEDLTIGVAGNHSSSPQIYATIHLGSYKLIAHQLLQSGINLCIPISKKVYNEQSDEFIDLAQKTKSYQGKIDFVNIEERIGIFKLIKYVKQGYSLLFYLDGNSGIGGMERVDDKLTSVNFFNTKIMGRKGIGFLAHSLKLQIQPVVSFFDTADYIPKIHFLDAIPYIPENKKDLYEHDLIQQLWNIFCKQISKYPEQWEAWLYVDTFLEKRSKENKEIPINGSLRFNSDKYDFIYKNDAYYLYDLTGNILVKMNKSLFYLFNKMHTKKISIDKTDFITLLNKESLVNDIINKAILTT
jgi:lauroyl/myristoyl acyltransferase